MNERIAGRLAALLAPLVLLVAAIAGSAAAHDVRPAYLQIDRIGADRYAVLWRTPLLSGAQLPVALSLPEHATMLTSPRIQTLPGSRIERGAFEIPGGLAGKRIGFVGLEATITDVLVRIDDGRGGYATTLVRPSRPWIELDPESGPLAVAVTYLGQGIEHILLGFDHLLFLFGLLLIVPGLWMLVKTITAFTLAHSITLAAATLGYVNVPAPPLEAAIALSILFVGVEVVRCRRGETSFTLRHPWVVAFAFGLLHGFGFAGALSELGLPAGDIPLALLTFNIGVEIGQLCFVASILLLERAIRFTGLSWPAPARALPIYLVGTLGAFWTVERVTAMLAGAS